MNAYIHYNQLKLTNMDEAKGAARQLGHHDHVPTLDLSDKPICVMCNLAIMPITDDESGEVIYWEEV